MAKKAIKTLRASNGSYGPLEVLCSNAGFYIGRVFNADEGYQEPGSRESDYFETRRDAEVALASGAFSRDCLENKILYEGE